MLSAKRLELLKRIINSIFGFGSNQAKANPDRILGDDIISKGRIRSFHDLLSSTKEIGHPEFPILDKAYSPGSRIPCMDLIPFVRDRIIENDTAEIKKLMMAVIEGNPGIGIGPEWIAESIDEILSIPYEKYLTLKTPENMAELKAAIIITSKNGGDRKFFLTDGAQKILSWICIVHQPIWSEEVIRLCNKANKWIRKMAKELPYWQEYGLLSCHEIPKSYVMEELQIPLLSLSPAARLHLFYAISRGGGILQNLTDFKIRSLGINVEETSKEILNTDLMIQNINKSALLSAFSKNELMFFCQDHELEYRKSWKKEQFVNAILEAANNVLAELIQKKQIVSPNYAQYPNLSQVLKYAKEHECCFASLFFL